MKAKEHMIEAEQAIQNASRALEDLGSPGWSKLKAVVNQACAECESAQKKIVDEVRKSKRLAGIVRTALGRISSAEQKLDELKFVLSSKSSSPGSAPTCFHLSKNEDVLEAIKKAQVLLVRGKEDILDGGARSKDEVYIERTSKEIFAEIETAAGVVNMQKTKLHSLLTARNIAYKGLQAVKTKYQVVVEMMEEVPTLRDSAEANEAVHAADRAVSALTATLSTVLARPGVFILLIAVFCFIVFSCVNYTFI